MSLPDDALDDAARKFRYDRNLSSGSDTEAWLARWELDVSDWKESLRRALLLEQFGSVLRGLTVVADTLDRSMVRTAVHADAVTRSLYERFARTLSARLAAHHRFGTAPARGGDFTVMSDNDLEKAVDRVDLTCLGMTRDEARKRLAYFASLQRSVDRFHRALIADARIRERIDAHKLDWTRFSCRLGIFPDRDSASEALFCVRDDRRDLADVAVIAGAPMVEKRFFLDEAEPATRHLLRTARPGDVVGPVNIGGEWLIIDVQDKRSPSEADLAVRRRAEQELIAEGVEREIDRLVRWSVA
jgi:hypothetical protein